MSDYPYLRYAGRCVWLALGLAACDGLSYFVHRDPASAVSVRQFAGAFSSTFVLYWAFAVLQWTAIWSLAVFLGGVRAGMAFLFTALTLVFFIIGTNILDLRFSSIMTELWEMRALIIGLIGLMADIAAGIVTLIVAKVFAKQSYPGAFRWATAIVAALLCANIVLLGAYRFAPGTDVTVRLGAGQVSLAIGLVAYRVWTRSPRRSMISNFAFVAIALAPFPLTVKWQETSRESPAVKASPHEIKHIVLITIDTLRQDVVTTYNAQSGVTKQIDRVANDGVVFDNAFSTAPWTLPSLASMMTGVPFTVHGGLREDSVIPEQLTTLAETLSAAGYRTVGIGNNFFAAPRTNLDQGFQEYYWDPVPFVKVTSFDVGLAHWLWAVPLEYPAGTDTLTDRAIDWIKKHRDDDSFLWLHYFDPHMPYAPPREYLGPGEAGLAPSFWNTMRVREGIAARTKEERDAICALYRGEVRYVDANVGRLLDALQETGIYDDSLVILTSDHGEEHWDHDGLEHGHTLYNELLRVPLFVKLPKGPAPKRSAAYVSTPSLMPTILQLANVAQTQPLPDSMYPSLVPLLKDDAGSFVEAPILAGAPLYYDSKKCIIFDRKKLIHNDVTGREELYDLEADPGEHNPVLVELPAVADHARKLMESVLTESDAVRDRLGLPHDTSVKLDQQEVQSLKSAGYL